MPFTVSEIEQWIKLSEKILAQHTQTVKMIGTTESMLIHKMLASLIKAFKEKLELLKAKNFKSKI